MSHESNFFAKRTTYHTNGSGRDMYIYSNNGGYQNQPRTYNFAMAHQKSNQHVMTLPSIPCKTTHYKPNGTGRDTYIKSDEGGILTKSLDSLPKRLEFINSLRDYQPKKSYRSNDLFSQIVLPIKEVLKINERIKIQKSLIKRLATYSTSQHFKLPSIVERN